MKKQITAIVTVLALTIGSLFAEDKLNPLGEHQQAFLNYYSTVQEANKMKTEYENLCDTLEAWSLTRSEVNKAIKKGKNLKRCFYNRNLFPYTIEVNDGELLLLVGTETYYVDSYSGDDAAEQFFEIGDDLQHAVNYFSELCSNFDKLIEEARKEVVKTAKELGLKQVF